MKRWNDMLKYNNYVFAESIEQAYELNQKKNNVVIGGNAWLKMADRQCGTAIDLSRLGLGEIKESDEKFVIGAMVTLRDIEKHEGLNKYTDGAVRESVRHIVGTQFRNTVTVGGSLFGRFGFSDVLSMFIVTDAYVELFKGGAIPLYEFAKMDYDNDILINLIVNKKNIKTAYSSFRNQSTDFPVLTCAVAIGEDGIVTSVGARPARADITRDEENILTDYISKILSGNNDEETENAIEKYADVAAEKFNYDSNMRGSAEYRKAVAKVLIKRTIEQIRDNGRGK
jgi:CO/xanthine dehydrogenase FAD-binding subunit